MIVWLAFVRSAAAQSPSSGPSGGFDAHGFRLAVADPDPRAPLQFVRPADIEPLQWSLGGVAEYASRPLVFDGPAGRDVALENLIAFDVAAGFAPIDRVRIDVGLPVILSSGDGAVTGGPTPGDLRGSLLVALVEPSASSGFGLGLVGAVDAPTGDPARWLGATGPAGAVGLTSTLEVQRVTFSWTAGARFAPNTDPTVRPAVTEGGDTVDAAAALGLVVSDRVGLGIEASGSFPIDAAVRTAIGIPAVAVGSLRYLVEGGGYVTAGVGTGLSLGAGASPLRVVVGGGFGGRVATTPKDVDGDGFADKSEACPDGAETVNQFRDDDGCPDVLPSIEFQAKRGDVDEPAAALELTRPDGTTTQGFGKITASGIPNELFTVSARFGACYGGTAEGKIPADGTAHLVVPIARQDAELVVTATDAVGRPLEGAEARYLLEDDGCAPADTRLINGKGIHLIGAGPVQVFVTAPGYGVHQATLTLSPGERALVDAKLAPTQVSLREGVFKLARPVLFVSGSAAIGDGSEALLGQVASLMLSNEGLRYRVNAWAPSGGSARKLSADRAAAVVAYLTDLGVPADRLVPVGKGGQSSAQKEWVRFEVVTDAP